MRSKSRSSFTFVNARDPRQSAIAHAFYPQSAGFKLVTRRRPNRCPRQVSPARHGKSRDDRGKSIVPGSSGATLADVIPMSDQNDSVLGNLPRSRPGVRSDKRASGKRAGGAGGSAGSPPAPKAQPSTRPKTAAAARPKAAPKPRKPPAAAPKQPPRSAPGNETAPRRAPQRSSDPLGLALKAGEAVALTGIRVAGRMAGGVLRRLPRL
jgi:hypothetical protein